MTGKVSKFRLLFVLILLVSVTGCKAAAAVYPLPGGEGANSYIVAGRDKAAVIDPVSSEEIIAVLRKKGLQLQYVILTHGHFDHILGVEELVKEYPEARVMVHPGDEDKLADPVKNVSRSFGQEITVRVNTVPLTGETELDLGGVTLEVMETPGHTGGSICIKTGKIVFTGDTLFRGSVGRTDLGDGSPSDLTASLKKIMELPGETRVLPGHGETTTIGEEKEDNPFLQE